jgi:hypothetical protein
MGGGLKCYGGPPTLSLKCAPRKDDEHVYACNVYQLYLSRPLLRNLLQLVLRSDFYFVTVIRYIYGPSVGDQLDHYVKSASHANSYISLLLSFKTGSQAVCLPNTA